MHGCTGWRTRVRLDYYSPHPQSENNRHQTWDRTSELKTTNDFSCLALKCNSITNKQHKSKNKIAASANHEAKHEAARRREVPKRRTTRKGQSREVWYLYGPIRPLWIRPVARSKNCLLVPSRGEIWKKMKSKVSGAWHWPVICAVHL